MKREIKELKRIARGNLQGNFFGLIRAFVFCNLIVSLIEMPFSLMTNEIPFSTPNLIYYIAMLLLTISSVVLTVGQYCLHLRIARTGELHLSELFYPLQYDAMILEFKVHDAEEEQSLQDTVASALAQIEEKQYETILIAKGIPKERIRKYGFAFEGKS